MFLIRKVAAALFAFIAGHTFGQTSEIDAIHVEGQTMGTTYAITYFDLYGRDFKNSIDSLLREVNKGINHYDPASEVSMFNKCRDIYSPVSYHFIQTLERSLDIAMASAGHFDPTVMPLVNLWGFGPTKNLKPSQAKIDSIKNFVGYRKISRHNSQILKDPANVQLDFGGIGQGYGVDVIAKFLAGKKIKNFLVELGGEGFASGKNLKSNSVWKVGVIDPFAPRDDQQLLGYATIEDMSFTTSGNYFNYRIIDGKKYGHTISPFTGFPIQQDLISVSIFSKECSTADAWATAFMVAGREKSIAFLEHNPDLAAILISVENGRQRIFISDSIRKNIFLEQAHDH